MTTAQARSPRYRIAEAARLTGFNPTTLRFYESAGVIAPAERTRSGYRVYGDRDIERLRLIAHAKDLGCTLEEISGLVEAWDADDCGPVKHRLRALVDAKVAGVHRHITEQLAFAVELQATAATLAARPVDGPCDDTCGCTSPTATSATPIACSLEAGEMPARLDEWQAVLVEVSRRDPVPNGLRLTFGASAPLAEISRLAAAEYECCPFFAFAITVDGRGVGLEVTASADAQAVLQAVFGAAMP